MAIQNVTLYSAALFKEPGAFMNSSVKNVNIVQKLSGYTVGG